MRNIDVVMQRIYESKDFAVKGYSAYLKDAFFLKKFNNPYIVFLTQIGELSGQLLLHKYTFYSVNDKQDVAGGGQINFAEKGRLAAVLDKLIGSYCQNKELSPDELSDYNSYLAEMQTIKPASFKTVYSFFIL